MPDEHCIMVKKLSNDVQAYLKSLIKTRTIQARVVDRAWMLLWEFEAKSDKTITLFDDERSGRPPEITDDAEA